MFDPNTVLRTRDVTVRSISVMAGALLIPAPIPALFARQDPIEPEPIGDVRRVRLSRPTTDDMEVVPANLRQPSRPASGPRFDRAFGQP